MMMRTGFPAGLVLITFKRTGMGNGDLKLNRRGKYQGAFNSAQRTAIIEAVQTTIRERYVFPDEAEDIVRYLRARMKTLAYTHLSDMDGLTQALTSDVQSINSDHHLFEFPHRPHAVEGEGHQPEDNEEELDEMQRIHYGFQRLEILAGNIGYFDVFMFPDPQCGGDTAVAAMNFLAGVEALIIDLRDNGGSWGDMVALIWSSFSRNRLIFQAFTIERPIKQSRFGPAPTFMARAWTIFRCIS